MLASSVEGLLFLHCVDLAPSLKSIDYTYKGLFLASEFLPLIYTSILMSVAHCLITELCGKFRNQEV